MSVKLLLGPVNDDEMIWHGDVNVKVRMVMCQSARDLRLWRCLPVTGGDRAVQFCDQCLWLTSIRLKEEEEREAGSKLG